MSDQSELVRERVKETIAAEESAIRSLANPHTVSEIVEAARLVDDCEGQVAFTGVGKSGDVAKKLVSTFNSIGVTAQFVHAVEALHGDMGGVSGEDVVIFISNSGNTEEVVEFYRFVDIFEPTTVAITSDPDSKLGEECDHHVDTLVTEEGAVVELIPMASAVATLAVGDCIANALMELRSFDRETFGHFHPGGTIGKQLLLDVNDIATSDVPPTRPTETVAEATVEMSKGGEGIAVVRDDDESVIGILTDGDIRRLIEADTNFHDTVVSEVMTTDPFTVSPETPAVEALRRLETNDVTQLVVVNGDGRFEGVVHINNIIQEGINR